MKIFLLISCMFAYAAEQQQQTAWFEHPMHELVDWQSVFKPQRFIATLPKLYLTGDVESLLIDTKENILRNAHAMLQQHSSTVLSDLFFFNNQT